LGYAFGNIKVKSFFECSTHLGITQETRVNPINTEDLFDEQYIETKSGIISDSIIFIYYLYIHMSLFLDYVCTHLLIQRDSDRLWQMFIFIF